MKIEIALAASKKNFDPTAYTVDPAEKANLAALKTLARKYVEGGKLRPVFDTLGMSFTSYGNLQPKFRAALKKELKAAGYKEEAKGFSRGQTVFHKGNTSFFFYDKPNPNTNSKIPEIAVSAPATLKGK